MRILGIDPGLATVGYGVVEAQGNRLSAVAHGVLTTPAGMALPKRLSAISQGMEQLLFQWEPEAVAIEELFFNTNVTTAIDVAQARGALLVCAGRSCEKLYEYTPLQVKQALTGYGRADKRQIQIMVRSLLHLDKIPQPDDAADALAVAICHAFSAGSMRLFQIR